MEIHEAADIFPMDEATIPDLAEDIRKNGQQIPIERLGGKVLDGRRRLAACQQAGVTPKFRDLNPAAVPDPVAYVLSLNLHRRHLTVSQLAMVGARAREIYDREAKRRQQAAGGDRKSPKAKSVMAPMPQPIERGASREIVGRAVGVGGKSIDAATKVLEKGTPELVAAVDTGKLPVNRAARMIDPIAPFKQTPKPATKPAADGLAPSRAIAHMQDAINSLRQIRATDPRRTEAYRGVLTWIKNQQREMRDGQGD